MTKEMMELLNKVFDSIEHCLINYNGTSKLQIKTLYPLLAKQLNISEESVKEYDGIIRFYLKHHSNYRVSRGRNGGIIKNDSNVIPMKKAAKVVDKAIKNELMMKVEEKAQQISRNQSDQIIFDNDID